MIMNEKEFDEVAKILTNAYKGEKFWYNPELINETIKAVKVVNKNCNLPQVIKAVCVVEKNHETCSMHKVSKYGCFECKYNKQTDL